MLRVQPTERDALTGGYWRTDKGGIRRWVSLEPPPEPIRCGTYRGYRKHRRAGQEACAECREAFRIHRREERQAQRQEAA
jgi:hypothetical protein